MSYPTIIAAREHFVPRYGANGTGYGSKISTRFEVRLAGDTARYRRVYAMCYANAASLYVIRRGEVTFLNDLDLEIALQPAPPEICLV